LETSFDFNNLVDEHADYLFRYAVKRVRDEAKAEDLVQETFLAAIKSIENYEGKATPRTWLTSILKNKVVDHYRRQSSEKTFSAGDLDFLNTEKFFNDGTGLNGHWNEEFLPKAWDLSPHTTLESKDFFGVLEKCVNRLPEKIARAFTLREISGIDSQEVCEILDISPNNFWVMMHRARSGLRRCVEINWFQKGI
jgi:RNA polymerase sigma-70 factor (ECF subfamily)